MLNLEQLSDTAQEYFDGFVVSGTDDELFASGYLRGHVDLVIGTAMLENTSIELEQVVTEITASVNKAIKNGELEQEDIKAVNTVLNSLLIHISK
ncbi:YfcL family protein [Psychrosphaera aquimarina]|uniref:YfcL family protein n=1 Tax=Psychrosphaera aquimarina TaxID=2044854 RepID=A0ABU3R4X3_9GAMM|nr:YfcL family protein [Psychrosphaera aquimarina]MDU0114522.1 YfcL family protein [Psychrosphaera aquimarina]